MSQEHDIITAERCLASGDIEGAEHALRASWPALEQGPASVLHLVGVIRRKQGRWAEAEVFLRRAAAAEPQQARHLIALGETLAQAGLPEPGADILAAALALEPRFPGVRIAYARVALAAGRAAEALSALEPELAERPHGAALELAARALMAQERFEEALASVDAALAISPSATSLHLRATILASLGRNQDALADLDRLAESGAIAPAHAFTRGTVLSNLTRAEEAEAVFYEAVRRWPQNVNAHRALANCRWMRGDAVGFTRDFEVAVRENRDAVAMRVACADLLRRADERERAEELLREGLAHAPNDIALSASLGVLLDEMDRTGEGLPYLRAAVAAAPASTQIRGNLACALMRLGRGDEALREIEPSRLAQPLNQEWICYETMALRQIGSPRYRELCDYDLMVRAYDMPTPPGFANIAAFNEALAASLNKLHILAAHPLDQSLRGGSQTSRSLLHVDDPEVRAYLAALHEPIHAYMDAMGKPDPSHPWSGRKTGAYRLVGSWSVKLKPDGYHINHLHPAGWISSAYYVQVPDVVETGEGRQGWIKFGEPRWPTPGCTAEKIVRPVAGRLVLFPSYMWHGTIPFSAGERMTAPFDALPG
ncbi:MAG: tetratricopeptide repeat protein [Hyphomonadaceae bacterium]|nr:tetratricopeptide repeat protein [Hyphomonadaceae bacterium]